MSDLGPLFLIENDLIFLFMLSIIYYVHTNFVTSFHIALFLSTSSPHSLLVKSFLFINEFVNHMYKVLNWPPSLFMNS